MLKFLPEKVRTSSLGEQVFTLSDMVANPKIGSMLRGLGYYLQLMGIVKLKSIGYNVLILANMNFS